MDAQFQAMAAIQERINALPDGKTESIAIHSMPNLAAASAHPGVGPHSMPEPAAIMPLNQQRLKVLKNEMDTIRDSPESWQRISTATLNAELQEFRKKGTHWPQNFEPSQIGGVYFKNKEEIQIIQKLYEWNV